ncbi:hypothetical protein LCGC14_1125630, partial [marine sediment metagenome]
MIQNEYARALKFGNDDKLIVDGFVSVMAAAFCRVLDESVWMYFIGPPASGKTETIGVCRGYPQTIMLTTPTENCLMSGADTEKGEDPSLIKLLDGKVLVWKDFTALITGNIRVVDKILGELRDAYDQYCSKASGKVGFREYTARFGMIACVTDSIDAFAEGHQQLGQRFLSLRINRKNLSHAQRVENLKEIRKSMKNKQQWKDRLKDEVQKHLDAVLLLCQKGVEPIIPAAMEKKLLIMSDLLAILRTVPMAEVATRPELANRVMQQLANLGHAHCIADGRVEWDASDMGLLERVMTDSLSLSRRRTIWYMFHQGAHRTAVPLSRLAEKCGTSLNEIERIKLQWTYSGILDLYKPDEGSKPWVRLAPDIYDS